MSTEVTIAIVTAVSIICSGLLTALVTVWVTRDTRKTESLSSHLLGAYRDVHAFYMLEQEYCNEISLIRGVSADAVKRNVRKIQRVNNKPTPSENSTPARLEQAIAKLLKETK